MKFYVVQEVYELTGITENELKHLTRKKGERPPLFMPEHPAKGSGHEHLFSAGDIVKLKKYVQMKRNLKEVFL